MSTKETQELIVANMKRWQKIENAAIISTARVIGDVDNPIVRLTMEIIQRDSQMHYRVQQLIAHTLESGVTSLNIDELAKVWDQIEKHIELEKDTIKLAKESLAAIEGKKGMIIQKYLLEYLLADEQKHDALLANLEGIKKGMYPYG